MPISKLPPENALNMNAAPSTSPHTRQRIPFVIIDDEALARDRLKRLIKQVSAQLSAIDLQCIAEFDRTSPALTWLQQQSTQLVFLDIEMPGGSGIDLAQAIRVESPQTLIIFTSAFEQYAIQAFRVDALDYLTKPICPRELRQSLSRVATALALKQEVYPQNPIPAQPIIRAEHKGHLDLIPLSDIFYCAADGKYVTIQHLRGHSTLDVTLKHLEQEFPHLMLRIHRATLVTRERIRRLELNDRGAWLYLDELDDGLAVSRRHISTVKAALRQQLE